MIRRDVIKITGMDQDLILPQQLSRSLFLIASDWHCYIETAFRLRECDPFQPFNSGVPATLNPIFVLLHELASAPKNFGNRKLRDFVHWQKRVGDQVQSR